MSILSEDAAFNQAIFAIKTNEKVIVKFLYLYLAMNREKYLFDRVGVRQRNLSKGYIDEIEVSLPNIDKQDSIIQNFDIEFAKIQSVRELIDIYSQKIQDSINKVWGEGVAPIRPSNDEIMEQIESGVLVHPQNDRWHDFFKFLLSRIPNDVDVPNPLILGGSGANDFNKNQRLREHLKVAEQNDVLSDALEFLSRISESQWVKSDGNLDPNAPEFY